MTTARSRRRCASLVLALGCLLPAVACSDPEVDEAPPPTPPQRIDEDMLIGAIEERLALDVDADRVRAVLVNVGGKTVVEHYRDASSTDHWDTQSVTKSVASLLVGIAIDDGAIAGVEQTLAELLPERARTMSPEAAGTTLRELLTMTGGFPGGGNDVGQLAMLRRDPVGHILDSLPQEPSERFQFSDAGAHLVAAVLERTTGESVLDYARAKLFGPLGIDTRRAFEPLASPANVDYQVAAFAWPVDRTGTHTGWGLLKLRPADMMRLGELALNEGSYRGRRIVSADWIRESTAQQVDAADTIAPGYGYEWWVTSVRDRPAYFAIGFGGQLIEVLPEQDAVVVLSTEIDPSGPVTEGLQLDSVLYLVSSVIAPALE